MSRWLLGTNVVLRLADPGSADHLLARRAVVALKQQAATLFLAPQVLVEFWAVATRPVDVNGFGLTPAVAHAAVSELRAGFPLLEEGPAVFEIWFSLVSRREIVGKRCHDARLAAIMTAHGVSRILTLDKPGFVGFDGIEPVSPSQVASPMS